MAVASKTNLELDNQVNRFSGVVFEQTDAISVQKTFLSSAEWQGIPLRFIVVAAANMWIETKLEKLKTKATDKKSAIR